MKDRTWKVSFRGGFSRWTICGDCDNHQGAVSVGYDWFCRECGTTEKPYHVLAEYTTEEEYRPRLLFGGECKTLYDRVVLVERDGTRHEGPRKWSPPCSL